MDKAGKQTAKNIVEQSAEAITITEENVFKNTPTNYAAHEESAPKKYEPKVCEPDESESDVCEPK